MAIKSDIIAHTRNDFLKYDRIDIKCLLARNFFLSNWRESGSLNSSIQSTDFHDSLLPFAMLSVSFCRFCLPRHFGWKLLLGQQQQQNIRHSDFRYSLSLTHSICHMIGILITIQHTTRLICGNVFGNPIRNPWTTYVATHPPPSPYNTPPALLSHKHGHQLACPTPIVCHFERKVWTASLQVSSPTVIK